MSASPSRIAAGLRAVRFPLGVYAASRLAAVALTWLATRDQIAMPDSRWPGYHSAVATPAAPDYWTATTNWDGQWYRSIVQDGYPAELPHSPDGTVLRSTWAFYPLYPMLVRAAMAVTGGGFEIIAGLVSAVCGAVAVVLLYRLLCASAEPFLARATVAALCCAMAAPILQFAYPESLALALVLGCLWLARARRWGWLALAATALALTRPVVAPLGGALLLLAWLPWPGGPRCPRELRTRLTLAGLGIGTLALLWPAIAAVRTGRLDAYFATSKAWTPGLGTLVPGPGYLWDLGGVLGLVLFVAAVAVVCALALQRAATAWGPQLRAWALAYPLYLLTMTVPGPSHVRYLLLSGVLFWPFPAALQTVSARTRRLRWAALVAVLVVGLGLQYLWLQGSWRLVGLTP